MARVGSCAFSKGTSGDVADKGQDHLLLIAVIAVTTSM